MQGWLHEGVGVSRQTAGPLAARRRGRDPALFGYERPEILSMEKAF